MNNFVGVKERIHSFKPLDIIPVHRDKGAAEKQQPGRGNANYSSFSHHAPLSIISAISSAIYHLPQILAPAYHQE